jgi:Alternate to MurJ
VNTLIGRLYNISQVNTVDIDKVAALLYTLLYVNSPKAFFAERRRIKIALTSQLCHDSREFHSIWTFGAERKLMDKQLIFICFLTFVIHLIGTLAYSVRIAGVRTGRIAVSFALFSILILVSRTSNSFLGPFLAKRVESNLSGTATHDLLADFRWLLISASLATLVGAFLIPTFQRVFSRAVLHFQAHRSVPKLILHGFFKGGLSYVKDVASMPASGNLTDIHKAHGVSAWITVLNVGAVALWTVGVFASLYAGFLDPGVRVTSSTLSSIINGGATVMMAIFIDPHMSGMTDDVIQGIVSESQFRKAVIWLVGSRFAGTLLAQLLLVPSAALIVFVARTL